MGANLITGNLYSPILASQDSDYQAGLSGNKTLIMPVGNRMALDIEDANTIRANDGVIVTKEGRRIQIDNGAVEEWSIPTGTQGTTSYYLIGFKLYTTDESAEICETFVEKVNSATDTITENTFRGGATEIYISVGRITQVGLNIDTVESLIEVAKSMEELASAIDVLNNDLTANKSLGNLVDLTPYTSLQNAYVIPTDGYIGCYGGDSSGSNSIRVYNVNATTTDEPHIVIGATPNTSNSLFVKKGLKVYRQNLGGTGVSQVFYPLS